MNQPNSPLDPYLFALIAGTLVSIGVLIVAWRRRHAPGALSLFVFTAASAWWIVCYALRFVIVPAQDPLLWYRLMYAGIALIPPAFFTFALQYTGRGHWITRRLLAFLAIEPLLINVLAWTDPYHGLLFAGWQGPDSGSRFVGGAGFWAHAPYTYLLLGASLTLLVHGFLRASTIYRRQAGMVILGGLLPLVGNALTIFHLSPFPRQDLTPLGLAISAGIIAAALFWRGLLDLVPIARDAVVEHMHDGVVVFDVHNRIIDLNPAATTILNINGDNVLGQPARAAFTAWPLYADDCLGDRAFHEEIRLDGGRYVDLRIFPLSSRYGRLLGRVAVLRDVTELRLASLALQDANELQRQQLQEINAMQVLLKEQAIRDPLTDLYNRRFLEETLARELSQAQRNGVPLSLIIIDLDFFKRINDQHGHGAGDLLLEAIGTLLRENCRSGDAACRYGGEEFVVVLPGTSSATAVQRANAWRQVFMDTRIYYSGSTLSSTFSAGVAAYPDDGQDIASLLQAADKALYAAKQNGRNCVMAAS